MLLTQENYFSIEADKEYMSVSQYKNFKNCSAKALYDLQNDFHEEKEAFLEGKLFESWIIGDRYLFMSQHPEIIAKTGKTAGELKSNFKKVITAAERIIEQQFLMEKLNQSEKQVILTCKINDIPVKCCLDALDLKNKAIYDLKCMANFKDVWNEKERHYMSWYYAWGYVLQLAVYREAVKQNYGIDCDCHLIAATKEDIPDIQAPIFSKELLDMEFEEFSNNIVYFNKIKNGLEKESRCECCDYCKKTKVINKFEEVK